MKQDLLDDQDVFAFPEERQKAQSFFEGRHRPLTQINAKITFDRHSHELAQYKSDAGGLRFLSFVRKLRNKKNPVNHLNPVEQQDD